jgi:TP901 family phage tail tape measure protein
VAGSTTYNIKIVLSSNFKDSGKDLGDLGDKARGAGKGLGEAGDKAAGTGRQIASLGDIAREAAANFAGYLSAQAVFQGLAKAAEFAKDTILGFDDEMTQSLAIMGDVSASTRDSMERTARDTAVQYNTAVSDVAQGYYFLASAGYDAATSQKALGQVTAFAKAGMIDMEKATELAADAQNAMGLKSNDAEENLRQLTRITDVLTKANIDANGSVEQFGDALTNKAAASARLANISLESTVAVLEAFAAQGLKGLKAGEAFSIVLRDLQEKARTNKDAFESLGITVFDAQGAFAGFPTIIGQIEKALQGQTVEQANATLATLGFTAEGSNYIKTLIGMSGEITKYEDKLKSAGGATQDIAKKQMQSMVEQLKHIRAEAAELALTGFDKMMEALAWLGEHFGPAITSGGEALRSAAVFVKPLAEGLAKIAGGAVVAGLLALAAVLNTVTGFLAEHEGLVQALATVGLVLLVARLGQAGAAFLSMAADAAAFRLYDLAGGIDSFVAGLGKMTAAFAASRAEGAGFAASMRAAMAAISIPSAVAATAGLVGLGLAIYAVQSRLNDGERAAEAFNKQISMKYDLNSIKGLEGAIADTSAKVEELGHKGSTMAERLNPLAIAEAEGEYNKLKDTAGKLGDTLASRQHVLDDTARAIAASGPAALNTAAGVSALHDQLERIAVQQKIDPTAPGAAEKLQTLATAAMFTSAPMQSLHDAFMSVAAAGSTADDALKAYQTTLNSLFGVHIAAQEAENQFGASLDAVTAKVSGGINMMDAYNAKNREARDAVLGSANAAMAHAVSIFEESGSIDQATGALNGHIERLVQTMVATGMSEATARAYIATLHLTPENIKTTAQLNKDQAAAAASQIQGQYASIDRLITTQARLDISQAIAAANTLQGKLAVVASQGANLSAAGYALGRTLAGNADGAITLHQYASGGFENHIAQVSPPGTIRMWSEPETGGEAYIPLAPGKRERSQQILAAVAGMFGYQLVAYASGGITGATSSGGPGITVAPGAVVVQVNNPSSGADVEAAVNRATDRMIRGLRTELRTRRPAAPGSFR